MRLTEIKRDGWTVVRDGSFSSLGLCGAAAGLPILTFAGNEKFLRIALANADVAAVMVPAALAGAPALRDTTLGVAVVPELRRDFFELHNRLAADFPDAYLRPGFETRIAPSASISPLAEVGARNIEIGENVRIEAFVSVKENTRIGAGTIVRSGSVLGGTGLEFIRIGADGILPAAHCGWLTIGADVEIQYNCSVSRSLFPWHETVIGSETKIESLTHVAHGVSIGSRALIASGAVIGGSARIGDGVWIGPNATISSEVRVGDGARISLGAVVAGTVKAGETVSGNFAIPHEKFLREQFRRMLGAGQ
ncbi:hypothetical protein BEQ56_04280 [Anaerolineaceae bacterium oral taxon 439]|nr:hypothetical protein BEQ56_04280 [Anaerolineaceae bacterium oral taxon 439]